MALERKCMQCKYAHRNPDATPDQIIAGQAPTICIRRPPTASTSPVQAHGGTALMTVTSYPQVTMSTVSCGDFEERDDGAPQ